MRRVEQLISIARELSQNQNYDANSGISQKAFVQYLKNGHSTMVRNFINAKSKVLLKQSTSNVVAGQEEYDYPSDIWLQKIDTLEWSSNGSNDDWIVLEKVVTKERLTSQGSGYPFGYITNESGVVLSPALDSGVLRFNYIRKPNSPEKRSGKISAVTLAGGALTALTVDVSEASFDASYIGQDYFLCIVDPKTGAQKMKDVSYDSVDSSTGVFTLSSHTYESGETAAVGDYITIGKHTANSPEFGDEVEDFLIQYMVYSAKFGDASKWTNEAKKQMNQLLGEIIESYSSPTADVSGIPILNTDYLMMF